MCGRYYIAEDDTSEELKRIIEEVKSKTSGTTKLKTSGEIFPTDIVPVVANSQSIIPAAFAMRWGYAMSNGKLIINARSETASGKPLFRDGMLQRRCLIPASSYFEWRTETGKKIRYAIRPKGSDLFFMAGIYRMEKNVPTFSILTRLAAPQIDFIHNRMPVILTSEACKDWLNTQYAADDVIQATILEMEYSLVI